MGDTIFAQATPPGRSGVAVVRISGPGAEPAAAALSPSPLPRRRASLRRLRDPATGEVIDEAVLILFPAPGSFTGETVVEVQLHGSRAVLRAVLGILGRQPGLRPAEPGEFTRRALENGRLDLAQVEGLADLLAAETEAQRRQAQALAGGRLSAAAAGWRAPLVEALAHLEALLDFSDDGVTGAVLGPAAERLAAVAAEMDRALAGAHAAERIREGFVVAIVGAPNVGKSTLLNAIAGRDVALTSEVAGTTRDVLEVALDLGGLPATLLDTAGLRVPADPVEAMGIERARARIDAADLRLFLVEAAGLCSAYERHVQNGDLVVRGKADLAGPQDGLAVSGATGDGIAALLDRLKAVLEGRAAAASGLAHRRQQEAVAAARAAIAAAVGHLGSGGAEELAAAELRSALWALDCLVGRVDVETVLDVVFRDFCLGK